MYIGEQVQDFEHFLRTFVKSLQGEMWTMLPGTVTGWNYPNTGHNTVSAVPGVMGRRKQQDGTWMYEPIAPHLDVPVHYMGGGGFYITHPISQGDEGLLIYASRSIDAWWQNGGTQPRPSYAEDRMHSLSDAIYVPGRLSQANVLGNISQNSCQLRSLDGSSFLELGPGGTMIITAPGGVTINGAKVTPAGELIDALGKVLGTHVHTGVEPGGGDTGPPL